LTRGAAAPKLVVMSQPSLRFLLPTALLILGMTGCASLRSRESSPSEAAKWVGLAEASLGDQDPVGALQALEKAEQIDADLPALHHVRALAYLARNDLSSAMPAIRRARELDLRDSSIATTMGKILMDAGRMAEAEQVLLQAARDPLYRGAFRARTNLGILNLRRDDLIAARLHLDRAIQDSPEQACVAHYFRGQVSIRQGRLREAIRDLERSTQKLCVGYAEAELLLGSTLISDKQYDRARRQFLEIRQRFPGTQWADAAMDRLRGLP
jgi:Tfp pilus assembly protein PilF